MYYQLGHWSQSLILRQCFKLFPRKTFSMSVCDLSHSFLAKFTQESYKDKHNKYKDFCSTSRRLEINHALGAILLVWFLQITLVPWSKTVLAINHLIPLNNWSCSQSMSVNQCQCLDLISQRCSHLQSVSTINCKALFTKPIWSTWSSKISFRFIN